MTIEEIKKELYKQKPTAELGIIRGGKCYYRAYLNNNTDDVICITFEIPVTDMGEATFLPVMDAKLLNRWIVKGE